MSFIVLMMFFTAVLNNLIIFVIDINIEHDKKYVEILASINQYIKKIQITDGLSIQLVILLNKVNKKINRNFDFYMHLIFILNNVFFIF